MKKDMLKHRKGIIRKFPNGEENDMTTACLPTLDRFVGVKRECQEGSNNTKNELSLEQLFYHCNSLGSKAGITSAKIASDIKEYRSGRKK